MLVGLFWVVVGGSGFLWVVMCSGGFISMV